MPEVLCNEVQLWRFHFVPSKVGYRELRFAGLVPIKIRVDPLLTCLWRLPAISLSVLYGDVNAKNDVSGRLENINIKLI